MWIKDHFKIDEFTYTHTNQFSSYICWIIFSGYVQLTLDSRNMIILTFHIISNKIWNVTWLNAHADKLMFLGSLWQISRTKIRKLDLLPLTAAPVVSMIDGPVVVTIFLVLFAFISQLTVLTRHTGHREQCTYRPASFDSGHPWHISATSSMDIGSKCHISTANNKGATTTYRGHWMPHRRSSHMSRDTTTLVTIPAIRRVDLTSYLNASISGARSHGVPFSQGGRSGMSPSCSLRNTSVRSCHVNWFMCPSCGAWFFWGLIGLVASRHMVSAMVHKIMT